MREANQNTAVDSQTSTRQSPTTPNIHCRLDLPSEELWIDADPELLHRALSNLALNAMDVMPEGGTLTLSAACAHNHTELRIADTGLGLTPEECERLFTPYYTTKQHGTGLGLAIVQSVISDHSASIRVESTRGHGTTFTITFSKAAPSATITQDSASRPMTTDQYQS